MFLPSSLRLRGAPLLCLLFGLWASSDWAHAAHVSDTFENLVGAGGSLFQYAIIAVVYVVSFGFFIFLACHWTNVKSELGEAFGAAVFVAFFTVIFFFLSVYLKPYLDPYDPVLAKVLWVGGLICSGPLAIKTTYGETILNSVKTFLIAAILTAIVVGIAMLVLNALNVA